MTEEEHLDRIFPILMESLPEDVDLLLIGGFALEMWVAEYVEKYGDMFDGINFIRTRDFDFCMKELASMEKCSEIWLNELHAAGYSAEIIKPGMEDQTPEAMVIVVRGEEDFVTRIDLFFGVHGLSKQDIWKEPNQLDQNFFILSEVMTLYSRAWNVATLPSKKNTLSLTQLEGAISVIQSSILNKLESGELRAALNIVKQVVNLASMNKIEQPLFDEHEIDLLSCIPVDHSLWPDKFRELGFPGMCSKIHRRREKRRV